MKKKDFVDKALVRRFTGVILHRLSQQKGVSAERIARELSYSATYIKHAFIGQAGNYQLYEDIAVLLGMTTEDYEKLNLDICEFVLNKCDTEVFIQKFGIARYQNSLLGVLILEDATHSSAH